MNVLSLFDGISCGLLALKQADIKVDNYYASEISIPAIKTSQSNHPEIKHLGDVRLISADSIPAIDLLIGGSPCQGFSSEGLGKGFEDPRSGLFSEYVRLLRELKPKYFFLENVLMDSSYLNQITRQLGVNPVKINSSLLTAQSRTRFYWTNIDFDLCIKNQHIYLKDILLPAAEHLYTDRQFVLRKYDLYPEGVNVMGKVICHQGHISSSFVADRLIDVRGKAACLMACAKNNNIILDPTNNRLRYLSVAECCNLQGVPTNYFDNAGISNRAAYECLGLGWTIPVIAHFFKYLKVNNTAPKQLSFL